MMSITPRVQVTFLIDFSDLEYIQKLAEKTGTSNASIMRNIIKKHKGENA